MKENESNVALVTGGTGGIGAEICKRLQHDGYLAIAADISVRDVDNGSAFDPNISNIVQHQIDISDVESVRKCCAYAASLGKLKAVVNCAGILRHGEIEEITEEGMHTVWDVNVAGMIRVCRAARPFMTDGSAILNISSVTASIGRLRGGGIYGSSKAAMEHFTRYLATELAPSGIRVNALAPGFIGVFPMSPSMRYIASGETDEEAVEWLKPHIPLGRMGAPREMAGPAVFLLSDDASYITGHVLIADGGVASA